MVRTYMRLPAAQASSPALSPAPGEGKGRLGVLFGSREVVGHAEVGQVALRDHLALG